MQELNFLGGRSRVKEGNIRYIDPNMRHRILKLFELIDKSSHKVKKFLEILQNPTHYADSHEVVRPEEILGELVDLDAAIVGEISGTIAANFGTIYLSKELRGLSGIAAIELYERYTQQGIIPNDICKIILIKQVAKNPTGIDIYNYSHFFSKILDELSTGLYQSGTYTIKEFEKYAPRIRDIFNV